MKTLLVLSILAIAGAARAQNDSGYRTTSPGSPGTPAPNINAGGNPTAAAQLPSNYTGDPNQPTYPAATDKPSFSGGTVVALPPTSTGTQDDKARAKALEGQRRAAEPQVSPSPSAPEAEVISPNSQQPDPNPGALQGGPQP